MAKSQMCVGRNNVLLRKNRQHRPTTMSVDEDPTGFVRNSFPMTSSENQQFDKLTYKMPLFSADLVRLLRYPYVVSPNLSGMRCALHLSVDNFSLENLDGQRWVSCFQRVGFFFRHCLLDAVVVLSNLIVVVDCLEWDGVNVTHRPLRERLSYTTPLLQLPSHVVGGVQFRLQQYVPRADLLSLVTNAAASTLSFLPTDGFVFTPERLPYRCGVIDTNLLHYTPSPEFVIPSSETCRYPDLVRCPVLKGVPFVKHKWFSKAWHTWTANNNSNSNSVKKICWYHTPNYVQMMLKQARENLPLSLVINVCGATSAGQLFPPSAGGDVPRVHTSRRPYEFDEADSRAQSSPPDGSGDAQGAVVQSIEEINISPSS
jgi:hypothetical protein